jgi:hypothetical protein
LNVCSNGKDKCNGEIFSLSESQPLIIGEGLKENDEK